MITLTKHAYLLFFIICKFKLLLYYVQRKRISKLDGEN